VIAGSLPYVVLLILGLGVVLMVPSLATFVPDLAGFGR